MVVLILRLLCEMIQKAIGRIRIDSDYKNSTQIPYINKENFDSAKYSEYDEVEENSAVALDFHVVHFDMTFSLFILCLFDLIFFIRDHLTKSS